MPPDRRARPAPVPWSARAIAHEHPLAVGEPAPELRFVALPTVRVLGGVRLEQLLLEGRVLHHLAHRVECGAVGLADRDVRARALGPDAAHAKRSRSGADDHGTVVVEEPDLSGLAHLSALALA